MPRLLAGRIFELACKLLRCAMGPNLLQRVSFIDVRFAKVITANDRVLEAGRRGRPLYADAEIDNRATIILFGALSMVVQN